MLNELKNILKSREFRFSLGSPKDWNSVDVIYHPPHVERLWRQVGEHRLFLHRIWPLEQPGAAPADGLTSCEESEPLWHPHDWPSAMYVVEGHYRMEVGTATAKLVTVEIDEGSFYEMLNPEAYHSVAPTPSRRPTLTAMLTGKPWPAEQRIAFPKPVKQPPLTEEKVYEVLKDFYRAFEYRD